MQIVQQAMIETLPDLANRRIHLGEIPYPPVHDVRLSAQGDFNVEAVSMDSAIGFRWRRVEIMRRVERELLRDLQRGMRHRAALK